MDNSRQLIPHIDFIYALGHTIPISKILYQDYYGDRSRAGTSDCWGHDVEFIDVDARYHHWKQNQDGGGIHRITHFAGSMGSSARIEQWIGIYQDEVTLLIFNSDGKKRWESHYDNGDYKSAVIDLMARQQEYFI